MPIFAQMAALLGPWELLVCWWKLFWGTCWADLDFCFGAGGLNYQIEHHLFPSLPRHNLGKVVPEVKKLCKRHGLVYEACSMSVGTQRVLKCLGEIASHAKVA